MSTNFKSFWKTTTITLVMFCSNSQEAKGAAVYTVSHVNNFTTNSSSSGLDVSHGVSLNFAIDYESSMTSRVSSDDEDKSGNIDSDSFGERSRIYSGRTGRRSQDKPPGRDSAPYGVTIYNSLDQVPSARQMWRVRKEQKCFVVNGGGEQRQCWAAYVCGHRCEPVLLAINSYCRLEESNCADDNDKSTKTVNEVKRVESCENHSRWVRCQKPRKFRRCFARVCFRRRGLGAGGPRPSSYEDPLSIAIVRYIRPKPKHDLFIRRTRQHVADHSSFF